MVKVSRERNEKRNCAATGMEANECDKETITRRLSIRLAGEAVKIGQALGYELETINKFAPNEWVKAMDGDEEMINNMENTMEESAVGRSDASRPSMAQDIAKKGEPKSTR